MKAALTYLRLGANPLAVLAFSIIGAVIACAGVLSMPLEDWLEALD